MKIPKQVRDRVMARFGRVVDLQAHPEILDELADEVAAIGQRQTGAISPQTAAPFGVSWMDSWVAHWVYNENMRAAEERGEELATVLRGLTEVKFNERIAELQRFIREHPAIRPAPPDGGTPEPGVPPPPPPAGPAIFVQPDGGPPEPGVPPGPPDGGPPDGGPPEPGVPPGPEPPAGPSAFPFPPGGRPGVFEPPDAGPPEPGVPPEPSPPPEPTPPAGPQAGFLDENPWILYWFVSVKAPMLLEVIDLHLTRRLQELGSELQP